MRDAHQGLGLMELLDEQAEPAAHDVSCDLSRRRPEGDVKEGYSTRTWNIPG